MLLSTPRSLVLALALLFAAASASAKPPFEVPASGGPEWNDTAIEWHSYDEGIGAIEETGRPALLVFKTDWCPHCIEYSRVFHDPRVVELAKRFVMIRVDRDDQDGVSAQYGKFGEYVPRTLFVRADGRVDWYHHGANTRYPYFLDERDPAELIALMESFPPMAPVAASPIAAPRD